MKKHNKGFTVFELLAVILIVCIIIIGGAGWIQNLTKLAACDFKAPYKAEIIHSIGIVPPIGAVTGWLNVGK